MSEAAIDTTKRTLRRRRITIIAAAVFLILLVSTSLVLIAGDVAFLSRACGSCHAIAPSVASWHQGPHAKVGCYRCHERKAPITTKIEKRTQRLSRDVWAHLTRAEVATPSADLSIVDASCEQCHDPTRQPTSGGSVIIEHENHAKRNDSCLSCHLSTGHPGPKNELALERMQLCFDCHSKKINPTASRQCDACHPPNFELTPASHKPPLTWAKEHGGVALTDQTQCEMCHLGQLCADCHGLVMPHPEGWKSSKEGHPALSKKDGRTCRKCHEAEPEPCTTCHHDQHDPRRGPWATNHSFVVKSGGAAQCMDCHPAHYCAECHTKPAL